MLKKSLTLIMLSGLLLIHFRVSSQSFEMWYEDYDAPGFDHIPSSIVNQPAQHYSIAVSLDAFSVWSRIMVTKIDPNGVPLIKKVISDQNLNSLTPIKIISAGNDNYVILAKTGNHPDGPGNPVLIKIDQNLNVLWSQLYADFGNSTIGWPRDIILDSRGNFVTVGYNNSAGMFLPRTYIIVTDQAGTMVNANSFVDGNDKKGGILAKSVAESPELDGYYITGNIVWDAIYHSEKPFLLKTRTNCSFIFNYVYGGATQKVNSIVALNDKLYVYGIHSQMLAFDQAGNLLDVANITSPGNFLHGFEIRPTDRNTLICGGRYASGAYFYEIDPTFATVNGIHIYPNFIPSDFDPVLSGTGFFDLVSLRDNDIIYAGQFDNGTDDLGIVKMKLQSPSCGEMLDYEINHDEFWQIEVPLLNDGGFLDAPSPVVHDPYLLEQILICESSPGFLPTASNEMEKIQKEKISTYPNPFNSVIRLTVAADQKTDINVIINNIQGKHIATLPKGAYTNGNYEFVWTPDESVVHGVYFAEVNVGEHKSYVKLIYVK